MFYHLGIVLAQMYVDTVIICHFFGLKQKVPVRVQGYKLTDINLKQVRLATGQNRKKGYRDK